MRAHPAANRLLIARVSPCATRLTNITERESPWHGTWLASVRGARGGAPLMGATRDAAASFRPRVTDTQHFEPVSPHGAGAAPRRRNHACSTGIGCAMTLRSLPRQNSQIEAIQCASKDA